MAEVLLVIDVQRELVDALPAARRAEFLNTIANLIGRARSGRTHVIFVRHHDDYLREHTPGWEIAGEVAPAAGEPLVDKTQSDSFEGTDLAAVLAARGLSHLVLCGMQSDFCVAATARGAVRRGYAVTVVGDAHATYDEGGMTEAQIREKINRELRDAGISVAAAASVF